MIGERRGKALATTRLRKERMVTAIRRLLEHMAPKTAGSGSPAEPRDHPSSAKAASIRASIGVCPNWEMIRFASVRC